MSVLGLGVDVVEVVRVAAALEVRGGALQEKVFTAGERDHCRTRTNPAPHFAVRFAAKEAVAKAFGTGIGARARWREIEVVNAPGGAPEIHLHGAAASFAREAGIKRILVSLSHSRDYAVASVVTLG